MAFSLSMGISVLVSPTGPIIYSRVVGPPGQDNWQGVCCVITVVQLPASPLSGNERAGQRLLQEVTPAGAIIEYNRQGD